MNVKGGCLLLPCTNTPQLGDNWCATCTDLYVEDERSVEDAGAVPEALISTIALTPTLVDDAIVNAMNVTELRKHCKAAGLYTTGLRADLLERLHNHRAEGRDAAIDEDCAERTPMRASVLPPKACIGLFGMRKLGRVLQYWVRWEGKDDRNNTWEPARRINPALISLYHTATVRENCLLQTRMSFCGESVGATTRACRLYAFMVHLVGSRMSFSDVLFLALSAEREHTGRMCDLQFFARGGHCSAADRIASNGDWQHGIQ